MSAKPAMEAGLNPAKGCASVLAMLSFLLMYVCLISVQLLARSHALYVKHDCRSECRALLADQNRFGAV
jgi:hypothetical protein